MKFKSRSKVSKQFIMLSTDFQKNYIVKLFPKEARKMACDIVTKMDWFLSHAFYDNQVLLHNFYWPALLCPPPPSTMLSLVGWTAIILHVLYVKLIFCKYNISIKSNSFVNNLCNIDCIRLHKDLKKEKRRILNWKSIFTLFYFYLPPPPWKTLVVLS